MSSSQLFERPKTGEAAILVHIDFGSSEEGDLVEFEELAVSAGARPISRVTATRHKPDAKYFIGSGKAEEIRLLIESIEADVVLFNHSLSASQERNLEKLFCKRVLDRTGLILDIFAQRARSFEGKLQVELAQLKHLSTRLVRGWTHLERQKGGIGLRGPGETQLETDRRLVGLRIKQLQKKLNKVNQHRDLSRQARAKNSALTVSLVGYTNAGKSTLFNALTEASSYVADQLFATLDPTLRRLVLPGVGDVVLADTVGFIRNLPHDLVAAFRSTLQETKEADLLLHVVDINDPEHQMYCEEVNDVLAQIGADEIPRILVYNKIDLLGKAPEYLPASDDRSAVVYVSAQKKLGLDCLQAALKSFFKSHTVEGWVRVEVNEGKLRALLFNAGEVLEELHQPDGAILLNVRIAQEVLYREGISNARFFAEFDDASIKTVAGAA